MFTSDIRFFAELNDFLPADRKEILFRCSFKGNPSIKHLIESLGIPHTEVGLIRINNKSVDFSYLLKSGDQIMVYPASAELDSLQGLARSTISQTEPRFLLDNHLGKLATYLRILGFDVLYRNDYQDDDLVAILNLEKRILLTRDRHLLMRKVVLIGYCVRNLDPELQLLEVSRRFNLPGKITPFRRCLRCNSPLQFIEKDAILHRLQPLTILYYNDFHICPSCDQIYWRGSHYEHMKKLISQVALIDDEH